jgi:hypothetical protein
MEKISPDLGTLRRYPPGIESLSFNDSKAQTHLPHMTLYLVNVASVRLCIECADLFIICFYGFLFLVLYILEYIKGFVPIQYRGYCLCTSPHLIPIYLQARVFQQHPYPNFIPPHIDMSHTWPSTSRLAKSYEGNIEPSKICQAPESIKTTVTFLRSTRIGCHSNIDNDPTIPPLELDTEPFSIPTFA